MEIASINLQKIPHFVLKELPLIEEVKKNLERESSAFFRILLDVCSVIELRFEKTDTSSDNSVKINYYLENSQQNVDDLIRELEFFKFKKLNEKQDHSRTTYSNETSITKKIHLIPVGDLASPTERMSVIDLGQIRTDRIFTVPITKQIQLLTSDYRWKNTLFSLVRGGGEVCITITKEVPSSYEAEFAYKCLSYYQASYAGKLLEQEIQDSIGIHQKIVKREEIFSVKVGFSSTNSDSLKLAFLRDVDLAVFELKSDKNESLSRLGKTERKFIERLKVLWSLEEVIHLLTPPYTFQDALPGVEHFVPKPFILPFMNYKYSSESDSLLLGSNDKATDIYIDRNRLTQHLFITGASGSGKTYTVHHLIHQLPKQIPLLIVDPVKRDYEKLAAKSLDREIKVIDFKEDRFLLFNPFIPPEEIKIYSHSTVFARALSILFPTNEVAYELILNMIRATYIHKLSSKLGKLSVKDFLEIDGNYLRKNPDCIPSFSEFLGHGIQWLKNLGQDKSATEPAKSQNASKPEGRWIQEAVQHFERRWSFLRSSLFMHIFSGDEPIDKYFESTYLVELYNILDPNESNAIFTLLIASLYEYRLSKGLKSQLQHLTIVEEAHRIIPSRSGTLNENVMTSSGHEAATLLAQMLAEIRAFGEGIIIVDQSPSKILPDVLINSSTKLIHRILYGVDKECLGQAMSLTQRESDYLPYLADGEAIAFTTDANQPVYITIPNISQL